MSEVIGNIPLPNPLQNFGDIKGGGLGKFLNLIFQLLVIVAGIYALINLILAGYAFMSAGDDPKKVAGAWAKIWQTILGLAVAAGAFVLAAIFGQLIFGQWDFILNPKIPTL
jgi:SNF family Na+-dependent transporter